MSTSLKKTGNRKKKIMVVDDDPGILDALRILLKEFGYEVETSTNGQFAYGLKKEFPDLILLDLWMSGVDGRDICVHLKGKKETKHIPIIIFSANRDVGKIANEAGADDSIMKPFEISDLLAMIDKHIR